jgi:hydrogenase/urease accessory protein HupE
VNPFRIRSTALACTLLVLSAAPVHAHDARPAYLEIRETTPGLYELVWRRPVYAGMELPVLLRLPDGVQDVTPPAVRELSDSVVEKRLVRPLSGTIAGMRVDFPGLEATITDVLVHVELAGGATSTTLVRSSRPWLEIPASTGMTAVLSAYFVHGVEHILFGFDHLLFVLALILIVRSSRLLLWTITAFTIAHSITLALATLGFVHVPGPPVEAAIALSILLLAVELVQMDRGRTGLSARWPWLVAFSFGLLHGFGFASALSGIGLPKGEIPLALFAFNVGVETGQLAFVATVLGVVALSKRIGIARRVERYVYPVASYAIGSLAAFWFFERLARF